ncbi:MAG: Rieske (2Fe-2S) protein, partial [Alphaproteobacteria bacterium]|nr:Rieske (2Fe-2S) protein [Alphaproteobacteria bacterium]
MTLSDLSDVLKPVAQARGLPNDHYVSDAVFSDERDAVLFANWSALTVGAEVPEAGDAVPVSFLGVPLVAVRGRDGAVRVFQNTCRHRGMILVEKPGKVGNVIRCPYHSWCYALSGELITTPHVGGPGQNTHDDIHRDELGLIEIRSHVWQDVVFVNPSGTAPAFEDYAADA